MRRHFLGWDAPVTEKVVDFLLPEPVATPPDLASDLIVVPTRQAGRRLREALALRCAAAETALLSARVETPGLFIRGEEDGAVASPVQVALAWTAVLRHSAPGEFSSLFPTAAEDRNVVWCLRTGEMLQDLREDLADGGFRVADVVAAQGTALEEHDRWEALAELERRYLQELKRKGKEDPCGWKIDRVQQVEPPDGVARIVVAAVPDPSVLMLRAVERLGEQLDVDILVHAPPDAAETFDAFGRPVVASWTAAEIDIAHPNESILLAASPADQARRVLEVIARHATDLGPADLAVGVPDRSVVPPLSAALDARGLVPFDPAGRSPEAHPIYRLVQALQALLSNGDYASVAALLRHPDLLAFLRGVHGLVPSAVLAELDPFQNRYLPSTLDEMAARVDADEAPALAVAVGQLQALRKRLAEGPLDGAMREMLRAIYERRELRHGVPEDDQFTAVATLVDDGLRELSEAAPADGEWTHDEALEVLLRRVSRQNYTAEREDSVIDLEGWLELPWNNASLLIVTGMNDGVVPDGRMGDVFVPDSLREALGLRSDAARLARDIYLLRSLVEARRARGRVFLLAGKTTQGGDPLKPSRLLFRCRQAELRERAEQLFGTAAPSRAASPFTVSFPLRPEAAIVPRELKVLPVTAFSTYLVCPFRFYLRYVLRMEEQDDQKTELDALDFGLLVHHALQGMTDTNGPDGARNVDALQAFLCERAEAWIRERFGARPPLQVRIQLDAARRRLAAAARCQAELRRAGWATVASELRCEMEWDGMTVRGMIDRVDRHAESGQVRIVDYKTSDTAVSPPRAHLARAGDDTPERAMVDVNGKPMRWIDLQLPLYRRLLATAMELPSAVEMGYFNLPKAVGETGLNLWESWSDALQASADGCAHGVIEAIRAERFWPPAQDVAFDPFERILLGDAGSVVQGEGA